MPSEIWEARFPVFSCFILFSCKRGSFDFVPRTANEWLYPRKNHNHNDNVDLGALGTAPKKTRRSLRRNWNSLPSSETLASHADVPFFVSRHARVRLLKHTRWENSHARCSACHPAHFWRVLPLTADSPRWNLIDLSPYWGFMIFPLLGVVGWVESYFQKSTLKIKVECITKKYPVLNLS